MNLEDKLEDLIEVAFELYHDGCDLNQDRCVDSDDFSCYTKELIEHENGEDKFDDFNIQAYAKHYAESIGE
jgi:hypothetical protein